MLLLPISLNREFADVWFLVRLAFAVGCSWSSFFLNPPARTSAGHKSLIAYRNWSLMTSLRGETLASDVDGNLQQALDGRGEFQKVEALALMQGAHWCLGKQTIALHRDEAVSLGIRQPDRREGCMSWRGSEIGTSRYFVLWKIHTGPQLHPGQPKGWLCGHSHAIVVREQSWHCLMRPSNV
jgi:hypothetical protein